MATMSSKPINSSKPSSVYQSIPGTYNTVSKTYNAPLNNSAYSLGINSNTGAPVTSTGVLGTSSTGGGSPAPSAPSQPSTYYDQGTGRTFGSYQDFTNEINNVYNPAFDYLNQAESAVRRDYPSALAEAEAQYKTNASALGNQKQSAYTGLDQQKSKATNTYESALADARRQYQEQQIGAQQRFGGSSSAGGAISEIQAREQARQFGNTNRQYTDLVNQVETQRNQVDNEYQTGLLQLEQSKQSAIGNANRDFQNKLLQIANSRAMLGQAKAEARLNALQQLRSEVFAIEQQNRQFAQTLEAQRQSALLGLSNYTDFTQNSLNNVTNQVDNTYMNASLGQNTAATGNLGQAPSSQQYTGAISYRNPNDPYNLGL